MIVCGRATFLNLPALMWGAVEMGLAPERRDVGGRHGDNANPDFLVMKPFGMALVLRNVGVVLFKSAINLRHLLANHGDIAASPLADMWVEWAKNILCRGFIQDVFWTFCRASGSRPDMEAVITVMRTSEDHATAAMTQRGYRDWMVGDVLSLADIWLGHGLYLNSKLDLPCKPPQDLADYYQILCDRRAYAGHVMVDYSEFQARMAF